ncbi:MAG: 3-hydroxybutyryl-CoA dehydrogenase [Actinomycetota bacterium]|nr:3-hydroxybutyryl-CoA dehydrogenase [Actinomycetota bacterium]MED5551785.1 3-hydroxybutyryl-CoA dehydrogenase [Actinomycetota bacterium]
MIIERFGVVGCGLMGSGIAEVAALSGCDVRVVEANESALQAGMARIEKSLDRAVQAQKINDDQRAEVMGSISFSTKLPSLADREFVVEAVIEQEEAKLEVFRRLNDVVDDPEAILASNTSSIPIMKLAMATNRPQQVIGVHFFNPVPVMGLVEIISSLLTGDKAALLCQEFASEQLGKRVVSSQDRAGFVVNALLIPYILSAIRMMESGFASAEDIDAGMVLGCNHPMGPLALCDLIGLDTTMAVAESLYEEFREQLYAPPPLLNRMCDAGLLGRKSGRGFYRYG